MKIDDSSINHNAVRLIDSMINSFDGNNDITECNDKHMIAIGYVKGVSDMANAMHEIIQTHKRH